jgi:hypothetical protein
LIAFTARVTRALANRENFAALVSAGPPVSVPFRAISSSFLFI